MPPEVLTFPTPPEPTPRPALKLDEMPDWALADFLRSEALSMLSQADDEFHRAEPNGMLINYLIAQANVRSQLAIVSATLAAAPVDARRTTFKKYLKEKEEREARQSRRSADKHRELAEATLGILREGWSYWTSDGDRFANLKHDPCNTLVLRASPERVREQALALMDNHYC